MTVLINCKDVCLEYPGAPVLAGVTLGVDTGCRRGIVGLNGSGKSSLLGVLAGRVAPDSGELTLRGATTVGCLMQDDELCNTDTVGAAVSGTAPEHEWASVRRHREIVERLIGDVPWAAPIGQLSGGERRRVDLARLLIGSWDVLLLDEPTNHLDIPTIAWLAAHLQKRWPAGEGALLVVTHDRWFLDEVASSMWEVEDGRVRAFEGGYSAYVLARVERAAAEKRLAQRQANLARKELAWLSRGAQARSTKPKFRVAAARELIAAEPPARNALELKRAAVQRLGKQVVDFTKVSKHYAGRAVVQELDWIIGPGERYGIIGANGAGKTTLLGLITGLVAPDSGRVKVGASVRFGILSQRLSELAPHENEMVRAVVANCRSYLHIDGKDLSPLKLLERLGFARAQLGTKVCALSGGERRRLQLLLTLLEEPNVLILDEPSNDLDTDMLTVMEDLLDSWPGTLLLVSHDRYLLERTTDNQFVFEEGRLRHLPGGVEQYLCELAAAQGQTALPAAQHAGVGQGFVQHAGQRSAQGPAAHAAQRSAAHVAQPAAQGPAAHVAQPHQTRKALASLERRMTTLEGKLTAVREQQQAANPADYEALIMLGSQEGELKEQLKELEEQWLALSE